MTKTIKTLPNALALTTMLFGLGACGLSDKQLDDARYMSCTELAREIGRYEQQRDDGEMDSLFGSVESALSDNKRDRENANMDSLSGDLQASDARQSLDQLNRIYRQKGCR